MDHKDIASNDENCVEMIQNSPVAGICDDGIQYSGYIT